MLSVIVFVCGAALMSLELVATRVLAPYLGNSIYVWGSVITVVMTALSLGYWVGGHIADRWGARRMLPVLIGAAALSSVAVPPIAETILPFAADLGPRMGSLVAAGLVFFVPSLLMATVSPLGVRLASSAGLDRIGRTAGGLYAVSTGGSIVGTLATSFWLIPLLSLEPLIVWTGLSLAAASVAALFLRDEEQDIAEIASPSGVAVPLRALLGATLVATALLGAVVLVRAAAPPTIGYQKRGKTVAEKIVFRKDTQYHRITVTEDDQARHLRFDRSDQTAMFLDDPYSTPFRYPDYAHIALALNPEAKRVLVLGLGGATIPKRMLRDYPDVRVDAVEIDPVVVDVAHRYFSLPKDEPRLRVFTEDARRYVQRTSETYDVVIIDAYYADSLPFHLTTREFLGEVRACMSRDGVLAYNVIGSVEGEHSRLFRSMYRTATGVWDRVWVFPIGWGADPTPGQVRNIMVLASDAPASQGELLMRIGNRINGRATLPGFETLGADLYTGGILVDDVPLLEDAHAPTDSLIDVYE